MKKVLVLEPNPYHSEVLPGIVKYFECLDYIVDVYIREEVFELNVFCRYKRSGKNIPYAWAEVGKILQSKEIEEYDFLFLSSMEHSENGKVLRALSEIGFIPETRYGVLGMYHTNTLIREFRDDKLQQEGRLFCISDFQAQGYNVNIVAPIYFVDLIKQKKLMQGRKKILIIGNSQDFTLLSDAYFRLNKEERNQLEIRHIGSVPMEPSGLKDHLYQMFCAIYGRIKPKYRKCKDINYLGKLDFPQMYEEIEKADFILVLIDPGEKGQERYINSTTSGSRQTILGFQKPCVLHEDLAAKYGIKLNSCIAFHTKGLNNALKQAIDMNEERYDKLQDNIQICGKQIFNESLTNLNNTIIRIKEQKNRGK